MLINRDSRAKTSSNTGVSFIKWAIEYEEPAGDAFKLNHREAWCLSIAVMEKCGAADDCILTTELTASLDDKVENDLPLPGLQGRWISSMEGLLVRVFLE